MLNLFKLFKNRGPKMKPADQLTRLTELFNRAQKMKLERFIIAVDNRGMYLRETLCVTFNGDTGERKYDTRPIVTK